MFLHFRVSVVLNDTMQGLDINMSCEEEFGIKLCTYEEDYEELDVSMYKASKSKVSHEDLVIEVLIGFIKPLRCTSCFNSCGTVLSKIGSALQVEWVILFKTYFVFKISYSAGKITGSMLARCPVPQSTHNPHTRNISCHSSESMVHYTFLCCIITNLSSRI